MRDDCKMATTNRLPIEKSCPFSRKVHFLAPPKPLFILSTDICALDVIDAPLNLGVTSQVSRTSLSTCEAVSPPKIIQLYNFFLS